MKKLLRAAVVAVASLSLVAGTAVSAEAAKKAHVNVVKLSAPGLVVKSKKCLKTKVTLKKTSNTAYWDVYTKVTKGGKNIVATKNKYQRVAQFDGPGGAGHDKSTQKDSIKVCPTKSGLGKATLGPSETNAVFSEWGNGLTQTTDRTKGHFFIRGKAKVALSGARDGKSVKLTATAKRFKPTGSHPGYALFNRTVKFQAKTGNGWKTLRTKKLAHGTGTITVRHGGKRAYRVTFGKISTATGATSRVVKL